MPNFTQTTWPQPSVRTTSVSFFVFVCLLCGVMNGVLVTVPQWRDVEGRRWPPPPPGTGPMTTASSYRSLHRKQTLHSDTEHSHLTPLPPRIYDNKRTAISHRAYNKDCFVENLGCRVVWPVACGFVRNCYLVGFFLCWRSTDLVKRTPYSSSLQDPLLVAPKKNKEK